MRLTRQAALADARLADQQNEATAALAPRTLELLHQGVEFWPATDEWRLDLLGDSRRIDLDRLQAKPDAAAAPLHGVPTRSRTVRPRRISPGLAERWSRAAIRVTSPLTKP